MSETWPDVLAIDAWAGDGEGVIEGPVADTARRWAEETHLPDRPAPLAADEPADERDWWDARVGWGLVLPDDDTLSADDKAVAADAPPAIQRLLAARSKRIADEAGDPTLRAPVLRWRADLSNDHLRRYDPGLAPQDLDISGSRRGVGRGRLPRYLLLVGEPKVLPWEAQYVLGALAFVGRLALPDDALDRYVDHLLDGWSTSRCVAAQPVVWAVEESPSDITGLMRRTIVVPVFNAYAADAQILDRATLLQHADATQDKLGDALTTHKPAVIVTSSHGATSPLDDAAAMRARLGLPIDAAHAALDPAALLGAWQPDGAIWYAHACCSAGADGTAPYRGLATPGSSVDRVLEGVAAVGAQIAPLPTALLSAAKPARAFVGQVEPTFNWTLQHPDTGQALTDGLHAALYDGLFRVRPEPVAMAFRRHHAAVGRLFGRYFRAKRDIVRGREGAHTRALRAQLTALDRQSLVVLGDPTVAPPALGAG
jgi:hypothetical protein